MKSSEHGMQRRPIGKTLIVLALSSLLAIRTATPADAQDYNGWVQVNSEQGCIAFLSGVGGDAWKTAGFRWIGSCDDKGRMNGPGKLEMHRGADRPNEVDVNTGTMAHGYWTGPVSSMSYGVDANRQWDYAKPLYPDPPYVQYFKLGCSYYLDSPGALHGCTPGKANVTFRTPVIPVTNINPKSPKPVTMASAAPAPPQAPRPAGTGVGVSAPASVPSQGRASVVLSSEQIAACDKAVADNEKRWNAVPGDQRELRARMGLFEKALFTTGNCQFHPDAAGRLARAQALIGDWDEGAPPSNDRTGVAIGAAQPSQTASQGAGPGLPPSPGSRTLVNQCLKPVRPGEPGAGVFGMFENSCHFAVYFNFCNLNPKKDSWADSFNCQAKGGIGLDSVGADSVQGAHIGGELTYFFACRSPQTPKVTFQLGRGLIGECS
jgi:hypothetical protein